MTLTVVLLRAQIETVADKGIELEAGSSRRFVW
jgi:hypothetical protein